MTAHNHTQFVEGCYRCDLSRDEVTEYTPTTEEVRDALMAVEMTKYVAMLRRMSQFDPPQHPGYGDYGSRSMRHRADGPWLPVAESETTNRTDGSAER